ncbi:MAG TPA: hypothetical protein VNN21_02425 [Dehalococcoidia bacterium]|nr:hypothetical protein [Dehalococcoidia bacterium]
MALAGLLLSACEDELPSAAFTDFNEFVVEIADALADHDVERLVTQTARVQVVCDPQLIASSQVCQGQAVGARVQGFAVDYPTRGTVLLDGSAFRQLLEGMVFGEDLQAPADQFGKPDLQVFSTLYPDKTPFFPSDRPGAVPDRGDIAITYVGRSPSEDADVKRRLWAAIAEKDSEGYWRVRIWLAGYFRPDHPALNPSEANGFKRWTP